LKVGSAMDQLLPIGSMRSTAEYRRYPRLWVFPPSLDSGKAHMCLRLSSAWPFAEVNAIDTAADTYTVDFCRLNPNMTVPVLEIEDKVITDSRLIADFLSQRYTGEGDGQAILAGKVEPLTRFVNLASSWDETIHEFSRPSRGSGRLLNRLEVTRLRENYLEAADERHVMGPKSSLSSSCSSASSADDSGTDGDIPRSSSCILVGDVNAAPRLLTDRNLLREAYVRKIANVENREDIAGHSRSGTLGEKEKATLEKNRRVLDDVWKAANNLLEGRPKDHFLFGPELTTADAFLVPLILRLLRRYPKDLKRYFKQFPLVKSYWKRVKDREEAQVVVAMPMYNFEVPCCQLTAVMCGCIRSPSLPEEVEQRIRELRAHMQP